MSLTEIATAFVTIFLAELPDKTMVATIMLVARHRLPLAVWIGATTAFALHVTVAVVAGNLLSRIPERAVGGTLLLLFLSAAVAMLRAAGRNDGESARTDGTSVGPPVAATRAILGSFAFVALAEWGDLTQIATAGLAARSDSFASTWIGALAGLATVAALAAVLGNRLGERLPIRHIQLMAALVFAALAGWTLMELLGVI